MTWRNFISKSLIGIAFMVVTTNTLYSQLGLTSREAIQQHGNPDWERLKDGVRTLGWAGPEILLFLDFENDKCVDVVIFRIEKGNQKKRKPWQEDLIVALLKKMAPQGNWERKPESVPDGPDRMYVCFDKAGNGQFIGVYGTNKDDSKTKIYVIQ